MKKIITVFINLLLVLITYSQDVYLMNFKEKELYVGIENQLLLNIGTGENCENIIFETSNGNIKSKDCICKVYPKEVGDVLIKIKVVNINDTLTIYKKKYRAVDIPLPVAKVAGRNGGHISKNELVVQKGIGIELEEIPLQVRFYIENYNLIILRQGEVLFQKQMSGFYFDKEILDIFNKLKSLDVVLFSNIVVSNNHKETYKINPFELTIE